MGPIETAITAFGACLIVGVTISCPLFVANHNRLQDTIGLFGMIDEQSRTENARRKARNTRWAVGVLIACTIIGAALALTTWAHGWTLPAKF